MIDEASRRRDEFDPEHSAPVVLSDGQTWYLPKPWVAIHPVFEGGKIVRTWACLTCGPDLDALVGAIAEAEGVEAISAVMMLGAFLLLRNYDLADDEVSSLFVYTARQQASEDMVRAIISTATGRDAPKAWGAGAA